MANNEFITINRNADDNIHMMRLYMSPNLRYFETRSVHSYGHYSDASIDESS